MDFLIFKSISSTNILKRTRQIQESKKYIYQYLSIQLFIHISALRDNQSKLGSKHFQQILHNRFPLVMKDIRDAISCISYFITTANITSSSESEELLEESELDEEEDEYLPDFFFSFFFLCLFLDELSLPLNNFSLCFSSSFFQFSFIFSSNSANALEPFFFFSSCSFSSSQVGLGRFK